jgi:large subunit ribosomal protein L10
MASQNVLEQKQAVVSQITDKIKESSAVIFLDYRGLTVGQISELRDRLRKINSEIKIYKNSLTRRALANLDLQIDEDLFGPNAIAFSKDIVEPIKIITDYAKENDKLDIKLGIIDGAISTATDLAKLATIPSRHGLLTMLAGGMLGIAKDLSICLHLLSEQKSE